MEWLSANRISWPYSNLTAGASCVLDSSEILICVPEMKTTDLKNKEMQKYQNVHFLEHLV